MNGLPLAPDLLPTCTASMRPPSFRLDRRAGGLILHAWGSRALGPRGFPASSESEMGPNGVDGHGSAVPVVPRVQDKLAIGCDGHPFEHLDAVVGLHDLLGAIVEGAVTEDEPLGSARGQVRPVARHDRVDNAGEAQGVGLAAPKAAAQAYPGRRGAVDLGEGKRLRPAVVPAQPREGADVLGKLLVPAQPEADL